MACTSNSIPPVNDDVIIYPCPKPNAKICHHTHQFVLRVLLSLGYTKIELTTSPGRVKKTIVLIASVCGLSFPSNFIRIRYDIHHVYVVRVHTRDKLAKPPSGSGYGWIFTSVDQWDVIMHSCLHFNGSLVKPPLKLGPQWLITFHTFMKT